MSGDPEDDLALVSARFSALWAVLAPEGEARPLMIDRVRDALDRGRSRLAPDAPDLIANSFCVDETVYASDRTLVLKLRHRDLGTPHALKTLPPARRDDVVLRQWLLHEARLAGTLVHPNIIPLRATLRLADGRPALLSDWMPATLSQRLAARPLALSEIVAIMKALLSALGYLHAQGIVHGDISPANLFFADDDCRSPKLGDFGLALARGERLEDLHMARGAHPEFAAPEQRAGARPDASSDLYSCGRILETLVARCDAEKDEKSALSALASRLTQAEPANRPHDAIEAAALLDEARRP
ncbi:serine/threonine-protein kinase [Ensifer sp. BR816]|jgi:type VI secretion system protein ImpN|uniref:serine/threonine-protein kinase n=1 Tax=Rhizobium sp. (strain BR816) TaxID=1057002 RepID=UPI00037A951E|nr:serine/threonine-protein kinase [Ensifer sp. BR816]